ncbi:MAG: uracil-DNA glycosylase [Balneolaceae bacterium]|nr:uracil-DNA glycosylase [Balneolaceae bacterium]
MSKLNKDPSELIKEIHDYLQKEREMYGDFNTPDNLAKSLSIDPEQTYDEISSKEQKQTQDASSPKREELSIQQRLENCSNLDQLRALCEKAPELKTDLEGTNLVFGVGNPTADLMIIGEAPGEEEDKQGEPFVGKAGQLLNKILAAIEFSRDDVYIANILKHRPPNNRNPKPEERQRSLPYLLKQIDLVNPKLILSLGKVSAQTLLDSDLPLGKMRGEFHSLQK